MSYFVIQDFRLGLDRRKHILTMPPGALYDAKNCVINRGGEPETCKAFVQHLALPGSQTFGLVAAAGLLYTFGSAALVSIPDGIMYQRLQHPSGADMVELIWAKAVKGKVYAIAAFSGGLICSFYDGAVVTDWSTGAVGGTLASNADVAAHFATIISTDPAYSASSLGAVTTITGQPGVAFTCTASHVNGGAVADETATPALFTAAVAGTAETRSKGSLTINGASTGDQVSSVKVNGVEILGATKTKSAGMSDAGFATLLAGQINNNISVPDYSAQAVGNVVNIIAAAGTGTGPNGFVVARTISGGAGTVVAANMAGGIAAVAGIAQVSKVTFGGTFEVADVFSITLAGKVFGGTAGGEQATVALPHRGRTYAIAGPNLFGSALGDATEWNGGTGSFVTDMSSENSGAERLTALGLFQGRLAVFARSVIQIMAVDSAPANIEQAQVLENTGTMAPKTVQSYGDADLFYLADTGVRSLRVRSNTLNAITTDLGSPIDALVTAAIKSVGGSATKSVAVFEPIDGRYLLHIGQKTYAFSYFPDAKVSAWTTWDTNLSITHFAVLENRVYARAGDAIYLLGGEGNDQYASEPMDITIPFLSANQLATLKHFTGINIAAEGVFDVSMGTDPNQPDVREPIGKITKSTFGLGHFPIDGDETVAISLHIVGKAGQYGRVAAMVVHYETVGEE